MLKHYDERAEFSDESSSAPNQLSIKQLRGDACCIWKQASPLNTLSIRQLSADTLIPWILDKGLVGGQLGRRDREEAAVGREGRAGV